MTDVEQRARDLFRRTFRGEPYAVVRAPGRVNLLGDHTDYTGGFVLPAALKNTTAVAYAGNKTEVVEMVSDGAVGSIRFVPGQTGVGGWGAYAAGVAWALLEAGFEVAGLDCAIASDVPLGSGLSSSAALEVALARAWRQACRLELTDVRLAELCRKAENRYVGVPSGIMDQLTASVAAPGQAILLDCHTLEYQPLPIPDGWRFVVVDSGVSRQLAGSLYGERVSQCSQAAEALGLPWLRDLRAEHLDQLEGTLKMRARHVYSENDRVRRGAVAMRRGRIESFGTLMTQSHESLRGDYQVSSPQLDAVVEGGLAFAGCVGARLTGAGLGGCTVHLLHAELATGFGEHLRKQVPAARIVTVVSAWRGAR